MSKKYKKSTCSVQTFLILIIELLRFLNFTQLVHESSWCSLNHAGIYRRKNIKLQLAIIPKER